MVQTKDRYIHSASATNDIRLPPWKGSEHHKSSFLLQPMPCQGIMSSTVKESEMVAYTKHFSSSPKASLGYKIFQDIQKYEQAPFLNFFIELKNISKNKQYEWHLYSELKWKQKYIYTCLGRAYKFLFSVDHKVLGYGRISKQAFFHDPSSMEQCDSICISRLDGGELQRMSHM